MHTSHDRAPQASTMPRWEGTSPIRCGTKKALAVTKVTMMLPGGPISVASQTVLCTAASSEASSTSSGVEAIRDELTSATATLATMPSTTQARVRARAAYGCAWP